MKKDGFFSKKLSVFSKMVNVASSFQLALHVVRLLKKSENVQEIDIFGECRFVFLRENLLLLKSRPFWQKSIESVSNGLLASEIWKNSNVGASWKITWGFSRKYLIFFSNAVPSNFFEESFSQGFSVWKIAEMSKSWIFLKRRWFHFGKKNLTFLNVANFGKFFLKKHLEVYYCLRVLETFKKIVWRKKECFIEASQVLKKHG